MPNLGARALKFNAEVASLDSPDEILDTLDQHVSRYTQVRVYGTWQTEPGDAGLSLGTNWFLHRSLPPGFADRFLARARENPRLVLSKLMAQSRRRNFTFTECFRELQPSGNDLWAFHFWREEGVRDGLFCCCEGWLLVYWTGQLLHLPQENRHLLDLMAARAVDTIKTVMAKKLPKPDLPGLTAREKLALQHLVNGLDIPTIAKQMAVGPETVKTFLDRAQRKLGAKSRAEAVAIAVRLRIVT